MAKLSFTKQSRRNRKMWTQPWILGACVAVAGLVMVMLWMQRIPRVAVMDGDDTDRVVIDEFQATGDHSPASTPEQNHAEGFSGLTGAESDMVKITEVRTTKFGSIDLTDEVTLGRPESLSADISYGDNQNNDAEDTTSESAGGIGLTVAAQVDTAEIADAESESSNSDPQAYMQRVENWLEGPVRVSPGEYARQFSAFIKTQPMIGGQYVAKAAGMMLGKFETIGDKRVAMENAEGLTELASRASRNSLERSAVLLEFASLYSTGGLQDEGISLAESAAEWNKANYDAMRFLVSLHSSRGDYDKALKWSRLLLLNNPGDPRFASVQLRLFVENNDVEEALDHLQDHRDLAVDDPGFAVVAIMAMSKIGNRVEDRESLIALIRQIGSAHPDSRAVRLNAAQALADFGQQDDAIAIIEEFLSANPDDDVAARLELYQIQLLGDVGKWDEAEQAYLALLDREEDDHEFEREIRNNLAQLWIEQGRNLEEAEELISAVLAEESTNPAFIDTYGQMMLAKNQPEEALEQFEKALELLGDEHPEVLEHMGLAYRQLGKEDVAKDIFQRAIEQGADIQLEE